MQGLINGDQVQLAGLSQTNSLRRRGLRSGLGLLAGQSGRAPPGFASVSRVAFPKPTRRADAAWCNAQGFFMDDLFTHLWGLVSISQHSSTVQALGHQSCTQCLWTCPVLIHTTHKYAYIAWSWRPLASYLFMSIVCLHTIYAQTSVVHKKKQST